MENSKKVISDEHFCLMIEDDLRLLALDLEQLTAEIRQPLSTTR
jgi:hypothetical protein